MCIDFDKDLKKPLSATPDPLVYEKVWADFWKASNVFSSRVPNTNQKCISLLFPPPNITGSIHLGHALTLALQDAYARHHRMHDNTSVAFIPGYDHAGIATFLQLEKILRKTQGKQMNSFRSA